MIQEVRSMRYSVQSSLFKRGSNKTKHCPYSTRNAIELRQNHFFLLNTQYLSFFTHLQFFWGVVNAVVKIPWPPSESAQYYWPLMDSQAIFSPEIALSQRKVPCYLPISGPVSIQWLVIAGRSVKGWGDVGLKTLALSGTTLKNLQVHWPSLNLLSPLFQPHHSLTSPSSQYCFPQPLWRLLLNMLPSKL